jgi:hypothetical protein
VVALTFRATVDQPQRFARSKTVGAISVLHRAALSPVRPTTTGESKGLGTPLYARHSMRPRRCSSHEPRNGPGSRLGQGMQVARRRGGKKAIIAPARRLAVILHRMWADGTQFRWRQGRQCRCLSKSTEFRPGGRAPLAKTMDEVRVRRETGSASAGRCTEVVPPNSSKPIMWQPLAPTLERSKSLARRSPPSIWWRLRLELRRQGAAAMVDCRRCMRRQGSAIDGMAGLCCGPSVRLPCRLTAQWDR